HPRHPACTTTPAAVLATTTVHAMRSTSSLLALCFPAYSARPCGPATMTHATNAALATTPTKMYATTPNLYTANLYRTAPKYMHPEMRKPATEVRNWTRLLLLRAMAKKTELTRIRTANKTRTARRRDTQQHRA
ncbi:hypothetical protein BCR44DRAFT_1438290, partial [Catenaria anguillulae PL171]